MKPSALENEICELADKLGVSYGEAEREYHKLFPCFKPRCTPLPKPKQVRIMHVTALTES